MPVWASATPPLEQNNCIKDNCPACTAPMRVSEKKREMIKDQPGVYRLICLACCASVHIMQGYKLEDIHVVDILKSGGVQ